MAAYCLLRTICFSSWTRERVALSRRIPRLIKQSKVLAVLKQEDPFSPLALDNDHVALLPASVLSSASALDDLMDAMKQCHLTLPSLLIACRFIHSPHFQIHLEDPILSSIQKCHQRQCSEWQIAEIYSQWKENEIIPNVLKQWLEQQWIQIWIEENVLNKNETTTILPSDWSDAMFYSFMDQLWKLAPKKVLSFQLQKPLLFDEKWLNLIKSLPTEEKSQWMKYLKGTKYFCLIENQSQYQQFLNFVEPEIQQELALSEEAMSLLDYENLLSASILTQRQDLITRINLFMKSISLDVILPTAKGFALLGDLVSLRRWVEQNENVPELRSILLKCAVEKLDFEVALNTFLSVKQPKDEDYENMAKLLLIVGRADAAKSLLSRVNGRVQEKDWIVPFMECALQQGHIDEARRLFDSCQDVDWMPQETVDALMESHLDQHQLTLAMQVAVTFYTLNGKKVTNERLIQTVERWMPSWLPLLQQCDESRIPVEYPSTFIGNESKLMRSMPREMFMRSFSTSSIFMKWIDQWGYRIMGDMQPSHSLPSKSRFVLDTIQKLKPRPLYLLDTKVGKEDEQETCDMNSDPVHTHNSQLALLLQQVSSQAVSTQTALEQVTHQLQEMQSQHLSPNRWTFETLIRILFVTVREWPRQNILFQILMKMTEQQPTQQQQQHQNDPWQRLAPSDMLGHIQSNLTVTEEGEDCAFCPSSFVIDKSFELLLSLGQYRSLELLLARLQSSFDWPVTPFRLKLCSHLRQKSSYHDRSLQLYYRSLWMKSSIPQEQIKRACDDIFKRQMKCIIQQGHAVPKMWWRHVQEENWATYCQTPGYERFIKYNF